MKFIVLPCDGIGPEIVAVDRRFEGSGYSLQTWYIS
jgi:hypothetical protein